MDEDDPALGVAVPVAALVLVLEARREVGRVGRVVPGTGSSKAWPA